jgi:hypothetical protein
VLLGEQHASLIAELQGDCSLRCIPVILVIHSLVGDEFRQDLQPPIAGEVRWPIEFPQVAAVVGSVTGLWLTIVRKEPPAPAAMPWLPELAL